MMGSYVYPDKDYLKTIIIDPVIPQINTLMEINKNWLNIIYGKDNQEEIPAETPKH